MKIALAQFSATADKQQNLDSIRSFVQEAAQAGAAWVVLPEAAMCLPRDLTLLRTEAEPLEGPFVKSVAESAALHRVGVIVGIWERADGVVYNTVVVISSAGVSRTSYRKVHLYDAFHFRESDFVTTAPEPRAVVFDAEPFRIGVATCYDVRFPESARALIDDGADVMVLPAAWVPGALKEDHWRTLTRARAIENTSYVVAVNQTAPVGTGLSVVVDPDGVIAAELGLAPELRVVELSPARISATRQTNPSLANRRYTVRPLA
ncbi:carbon-nitrogen hydrolase family protein [Microbacterium sp. RD1]|uniref:carbon-nitrogen hydrolase family protein n=1 Tax=Microbacterium sp. RD1 TaxID=3457313 RepID=UPI003FA5653B